jgi:hypothetical protein
MRLMVIRVTRIAGTELAEPNRPSAAGRPPTRPGWQRSAGCSREKIQRSRHGVRGIRSPPRPGEARGTAATETAIGGAPLD